MGHRTLGHSSRHLLKSPTLLFVHADFRRVLEHRCRRRRVNWLGGAADRPRLLLVPNLLAAWMFLLFATFVFTSWIACLTEF